MELPPKAEKRSKPRKRVVFGGVAVYGNGTFSFRCRIRDISENSARIVIPEGQPIPSEIYLINLHDQTAYKARVISIRGTEAGLLFLWP